MNLFTYSQRFAIRSLATFAVLSLVLGILPTQVFAVTDSSPYGTDPVTMVDICHSTPTAYDNGIKHVNVNAIFATHANDNTGGLDGNGDIIPPFYYESGNGQSTTTEFFVGKNWNTTNEAIWNNDCDAVVATTGILTIAKEFVGTTSVSAEDFHFTINGANSTQFEADASNDVELTLDDGPFTIREVEADGSGYSTTYSDNCTEFDLTADGGTCTIY